MVPRSEIHLVILLLFALLFFCGCATVMDTKEYICHFELAKTDAGFNSKVWDKLTEPKKLSFEEYVNLKKKTMRNAVLRLVCT